jgi:hypothetical protein
MKSAAEKRGAAQKAMAENRRPVTIGRAKQDAALGGKVTALISGRLAVKVVARGDL